MFTKRAFIRRTVRAVAAAIALSWLATIAPGLAFATGGPFGLAQLEALLAKNPATGRPVDSLAELLPLLPRELRANFTFVHESRSPFRESISPEYPRAILFSGDARLLLTFTGDPGKPGADLLEAIAFDDSSAAFTTRAYLLPAAARRPWRPSPEDSDCSRCHGADPRPIFDSYPLWPGFYGSVLDAFPRDRLGKTELANYRAFLAGPAKSAPYAALTFPEGSATSPYLDPSRAVAGAVELDASTLPFLPNTRLGMALTELNRARIYRKLAASADFRGSEKQALAQLLECRGAGPSPAVQQAIASELARENAERLARLGLRPGEPRPDIDNMEELKFTRELAEVADVAGRAKVDRADWSMALAPGSLAFFDGLLDGMQGGKSYYIKEDLIYEILSHLAARQPAFRAYFAPEWDLADYGYPFGDRIDLGKARGACRLLRG
jgi:hypothetical protein